MPLQRIDTARNNLANARNSYADIQRQLDRYNRVFEAYAQASPETQIRANSVMRQAINEYLGLKKQQEENAVRIYEAQNWVDYYNNSPAQTQPLEVYSVNNKLNQDTTSDFVRANPTEQIPVISTATPGTLNNNTPSTLVENTIDTNSTMNATINPILANAQAQNKINPTTPVGVTNIVNSQSPKYPNTTIKPVDNKTPTYTVTTNKYGPGSVATIQTGGTTTTPGRRTGISWASLTRNRFK